MAEMANNGIILSAALSLQRKRKKARRNVSQRYIVHKVTERDNDKRKSRK